MKLRFKFISEGINMLEYKFDTQLLIEGENLSEDKINDYIKDNEMFCRKYVFI